MGLRPGFGDVVRLLDPRGGGDEGVSDLSTGSSGVFSMYFPFSIVNYTLHLDERC